MSPSAALRGEGKRLGQGGHPPAHGRREIEVGGQTGEPVFTLKQDGDKITGRYKGSFGEHDVTGKVTGEKVEFEFSTDQGKIAYTGTIDRTP